ncbi:SMP-30/gluconolactonase/LRE family protein [Lignipirellula cremea]|nr:SMP-30/gluconolactonase/LRE family protein [Lignipirellula cremea]
MRSALPRFVVARRLLWLAAWLAAFPVAATTIAAESALTQHWIWSRAHLIPAETTSEQSGYFSLVEGKNGRLYIGTAKYGENAFLVEFDPAGSQMKVVVDAHKEAGLTAAGFAAQAKIHTRNNVGRSGKIYFATKQGYPKKGESRDAYPGGYPMVYDPETGQTRVYDIPIKGQGVISITPDESRGVAYLSTCSDERPIESTHFMILDLESGEYRDLLDCRHMYAFIVVDYLGRAYHPILGGKIARYDPRSDKLEQLTQTIDGAAVKSDSWLAKPESHPINWDIAPNRKTLYAVPMSENQLYAYDLAAAGNRLTGRSLGPLIADATKTDCRAMCVGPDGVVWAGVVATFPGRGQELHLVSYQPGAAAAVDHGPIAVGNPEAIHTTGPDGKTLPHHHGYHQLPDGVLLPRYTIMGIAAARDGTVYLTTLYPFTLHAIRIPEVAAVVTAYYHNSHADMLASRMLETDTLDSTGRWPAMTLKSLYTDQQPANDTSRKLAAKYKLPRYDSVAGALTRGGKELAVDGVLLIAEHGEYPESATGSIQYPKRKLFEQIVKVMDDSGRTAPVFCDKHLADTWADAKWIYDTAKAKNIPLMAGSSLPVTWRHPPADVEREAKLKQVLVVSYHRLDTYGFHALEIAQCLAERRAGGETGVKRVRCLTGDQVWQAGKQGVYDPALLEEALGRLTHRYGPRNKPLSDFVHDPTCFVIEYRDGLRVCVLTLNGAGAEWTAAWRYPSGESASTLFYTQEARPFQHFHYQFLGVEKFMQTGKPAWPVERTLLTTGLLDELLLSKKAKGAWRNTPHLLLRYQTDWNWQQPPPPPPDRPIPGQ